MQGGVGPRRKITLFWNRFPQIAQIYPAEGIGSGRSYEATYPLAQITQIYLRSQQVICAICVPG